MRPGDDARQSAVSLGALARLDQGQEPGRAGGNEGGRGMRFDRRRKLPIKSSVVKHSTIVNGRDSSVSIEDAFWNALKEIAVAQNISAAALVSKIDSGREAANLSSAIRVYVLSYYRERCDAKH